MRLWSEPDFRALSAPPPNAQTLFVYLLTGEHTGRVPGLSRVGELGLAEAVAETFGWSLEGFREALAEVFAKGLAKADWKTRVLFVPSALKDNPPQSPNVVVGWRTAFDELPDCDLKTEAETYIYAYLRTLKQPFRDAFKPSLKSFGKPLGSLHQSSATANAPAQESSSGSDAHARATAGDVPRDTPDVTDTTPAAVDPDRRYLTWRPILVRYAVAYHAALGCDPNEYALATAHDELRRDHDETTFAAHFTELCAFMKADPQHHSLNTFRTKFNAYAPGNFATQGESHGRRPARPAAPVARADKDWSAEAAADERKGR